MKTQDLKQDMMREMFNIGVGKAASMLSDITGKKILLDVPNIEIVGYRDSEIELDSYFTKVLTGTMMVSSINFETQLAGEAKLVFPADKMKKFISLCQNEEYDEMEEDLNFTDIDFDIIKEVGNIILNSILGEIGNFLEVSLSYSLPLVKLLEKQDFSDGIKKKEFLYRGMLYMAFIIDGTEIEGVVIIDLTFNSLQELMKKFNEMEADLYG